MPSMKYRRNVELPLFQKERRAIAKDLMAGAVASGAGFRNNIQLDDLINDCLAAAENLINEMNSLEEMEREDT